MGGGVEGDGGGGEHNAGEAAGPERTPAAGQPHACPPPGRGPGRGGGSEGGRGCSRGERPARSPPPHGGPSGAEPGGHGPGHLGRAPLVPRVAA